MYYVKSATGRTIATLGSLSQAKRLARRTKGRTLVVCRYGNLVWST